MFGIDDAIGAAMIGAAGHVVGGAVANSASRQAARDQMKFQERMRATQYQTAVADMRKAGLNPALAYSQGGAGNLSGAMPEVRDIIGPASNSAKDAIRLRADVKLADSQADLNVANEKRTVQDAAVSHGQALLQPYLIKESQKRIALLDRQRDALDKTIRGQEIDNDLNAANLPRAVNQARLDSGMGIWGPILDRVLQTVGAFRPGIRMPEMSVPHRPTVPGYQR